jgi:prepilin signal peptidase PulO-like enzyme (type II secretory pathway)
MEKVFGWLVFFVLIIYGIGHYAASMAVFLGGALIFGTAWFYGLMALACVLLFTALDHDSGVGATATLLSVATLEQLFGDVKVFTYIRENPLLAVGFLAVYFLAGTLWSIGKWWFYVREERSKYDTEKAHFLRRAGVDGDVIPTSMKKEWADEAPDRPSAKTSKAKIMQWMSFWPWSMVWTLVNDPIKKAFKAIFTGIQSLLTKIVNSVYKDTEADFV